MDAPAPPDAAPFQTADVPEELRPRHMWRRAGQLALVAAVVAALVAALPGLGSIRDHLAHARAPWLALVGVLELGSCLGYVPVLRGVFCPSMRWRLSYDLAMSELGADALLPAGGAGGLALGAWALHRGGMSSRHIAHRTIAFFLVTSAASFVVVILAGAATAAGLMPGPAFLPLTIVPAALAAVVVVLVVTTAPRMLDRIAAGGPSEAPEGVVRSRLRRRLRRMSRWTALTLAAGVREAVALLRSGEPMVILGSTAYLAFDIAALAAAFPATSSSVPRLGTLLLGYTIGQLGGLIPIPGGLGATGGGLIGAFVLYGAPVASVTAATLVYRAFQLGVPAVLGAPAFLLLHRALRRGDQVMAICDPLAAT